MKRRRLCETEELHKTDFRKHKWNDRSKSIFMYWASEVDTMSDNVRIMSAEIKNEGVRERKMETEREKGPTQTDTGGV